MIYRLNFKLLDNIYKLFMILPIQLHCLQSLPEFWFSKTKHLWFSITFPHVVSLVLWSAYLETSLPLPGWLPPVIRLHGQPPAIHLQFNVISSSITTVTLAFLFSLLLPCWARCPSALLQGTVCISVLS